MKDPATRRKVKAARHGHRPVLDVSAFRGKWIAVDPRTYKVLGHGDSPEQATQDAPEKSILYLVPRSDAFFVGSAT